MKFELDRLPDYTNDALLSELRRVAAAVDPGRLTISAFSKCSKVGVTTLRRRFGSWQAALQAAGLAHLYNSPAPATKPRVLARNLSNDQILGELRRIAQLIDVTNLTADHIREYASVGVDAIRNRFGSLRTAFRAAGLLETAHGRRYTDDECFENLLNVWTHHGRPPKYQEMKLPPSTVGPKAYVVRWKTWNRALQAFLDRVDQETEEPPATQESQSQVGRLSMPASVELPEEDQHKIKLRLRYKVLVRDRFRCVLCGSSPALHPSCSLHVDHTVPWSRGGKTIIENLRTLCESCNLGKGNQLEAGHVS
jgi:hypothetical protein